MIYHRFVTRLTRHMSLVEQALFTLPEHMSSPPIPVTRSLVLSCVVCPFVLFLLVFVFFVLLRYTDSDYLLYLQTLLIVPFTLFMLNHKFTCKGNDMEITCTRTTKERGTICKERSIKHPSPFL
jgi:hypothetical protein